MNGAMPTFESSSAEIVAGQVWEEVARFGAEGQLLGILTRPAQVIATRPLVVLLNAGVLHRVGPHRLHVSLARVLAEQGFTCLRLDLGGIGDSPASGHTGTFMESAVADVRVVMNELSHRLGIRQFVMFGLCSGADNGFAAALEDDRIVGVALLDPHSYRTRQAQLRKLAQRFMKDGAKATARWGLALVTTLARERIEARIEARIARLRAPEHASQEEPDSGGRRPPAKGVLRADLTRLVNRGVKILAVYSGSYGDRYNHRDQLFELFPELRGRVDLEYFPGANHMFTERAAQAALLSAVTRWAGRHFA